jgi:hypothetical protein
MPERLKLTKNAQFYVAKSDVTDAMIASILEGAILNCAKGETPIIDVLRVERQSTSGHRYFLSARVFPSARDVYFISEELQDVIYAFIVIFEFDNYLALFKKSCANISEPVDEHFVRFDGGQLASTFDDDDVEYQKIALRNMTISDRAMRSRSFEAVDLKGLFSTHAAGRSIPYFLKVRQGAISKTFSAGTGRLVETSERQLVDEIADWAFDQINALQNPSTNKPFLESFAKLANLDAVMQSTNPSGILVESGILLEKIEQDQIELRYKTSSGKYVILTPGRVQKLIQALEAVYEIDAGLNIIGLGAGARIRKNLRSLTLHSPLMKKIVVDEYGQSVTLQKYLTANGLYSICFSDPKYMYFMGRCFEDASGVSEIDSILELLIPQAAMTGVSSEKGVFSNISTSFSNGSVFNAVEQIHAIDDYIFCDDLGNEWADHIAVNAADSSIAFIHSKHGDSSVSAGRMHEVVAQGIKNLGNMFFAKRHFIKKLEDKFSDVYKIDKVTTSIARVRKGNVAAFDAFIASLQSDFRLNRKCILACSFLSKSDVKREFDKIKAGEVVSGHVTQLLWIISSFAHAAKDANVIPLIYCRD